MKNLLAIITLALAFPAFAQIPAPTPAPYSDARTVLSTVTANGITTTLYVGRIQADPAKDGTITLTVYPDAVLTTSTGALIADLGFKPPFTVSMTAAQYGGLSALVVAAYAAQNTPPAPTPAPASP